MSERQQSCKKSIARLHKSDGSRHKKKPRAGYALGALYRCLNLYALRAASGCRGMGDAVRIEPINSNLSRAIFPCNVAVILNNADYQAFPCALPCLSG